MSYVRHTVGGEIEPVALVRWHSHSCRCGKSIDKTERDTHNLSFVVCGQTYIYNSRGDSKEKKNTHNIQDVSVCHHCGVVQIKIDV